MLIQKRRGRLKYEEETFRQNWEWMDVQDIFLFL